jgi:hypothetical protein
MIGGGGKRQKCEALISRGAGASLRVPTVLESSDMRISLSNADAMFAEFLGLEHARLTEHHGGDVDFVT